MNIIEHIIKLLINRNNFLPPQDLPPKINNIWSDILGREKTFWDEIQNKAKNGPKILIPTVTGGHDAVTPVESLLAVALTLRGADVHFLLCDKFLPACLLATSMFFQDQSEFPHYGPQKILCDKCFSQGITLYNSLQLLIHLYSSLVTKTEFQETVKLAKTISLSEIKNYHWGNLSLGEHAWAGALRFFARADLEEEPLGDLVLRRYFQAALLTVYALKRLLSIFNFECAVFHHGIYVPQGVIGEFCREHKIRVVNWSSAYRKKCFIFSHDDTYHHTLMSEVVKKWENMTLTKKMENKLLVYLKSRWKGTSDWIWFHEKPTFDIDKIGKKLGINFSKPWIGLLTNVMWDAQLHYPVNAFPNMLIWLKKTINYFKKRKDLQLIIRVHPAEIRGTLPSRQLVVHEIKKYFPKLPSNIHIIPPESEVSTYAVMAKCDAVIIYGTKTGVELTSIGIPVIVAGEAWIRNKGITLDAKNEKDYFRLLDTLPLQKKLTSQKIERARKYAYHFFFRRMIPIKCMEPKKGWPPYGITIENINDLNPGQDAGLDVICDGILKGQDFIYKEEDFS